MMTAPCARPNDQPIVNSNAAYTDNVPAMKQAISKHTSFIYRLQI